MERKTIIRIDQAKQKARPELCKEGVDNGWKKFNFAETFNPNIEGITQNLPRLDGHKLSLEEFLENYESKYRPCVVTGLMDTWPANERWTMQKLARKYRNQKFKCGEDDDGYSVKLKMKYFTRYMKDNKDDSPLYVFDSAFSDHAKRRSLLDDYQVPRLFPDDFFSLVGESRRPPYRWFVMGPARSGTGIHIDPLGTSAWNSLIQGHKRWCLFPPETPKELLKPTSSEAWKQKGEAVTWFEFIYPKVTASDWPKQYKMYECIQGPGETMFVPGNWWHVVLNLDDTIAITQNYCGRVNFPNVWKKSVKGRPKLSKKWYTAMCLRRPDLKKVADSVDLKSQDGYASSSSSSSSSSSDSSVDSDSDSVWSDEEAPATKKKRTECPAGCIDCAKEKSPHTKNNGNNLSDSSDEEYKSTSGSPPSSR